MLHPVLAAHSPASRAWCWPPPASPLCTCGSVLPRAPPARRAKLSTGYGTRGAVVSLRGGSGGEALPGDRGLPTGIPRGVKGCSAATLSQGTCWVCSSEGRRHTCLRCLCPLVLAGPPAKSDTATAKAGDKHGGEDGRVEGGGLGVAIRWSLQQGGKEGLVSPGRCKPLHVWGGCWAQPSPSEAPLVQGPPQLYTDPRISH